MWEQIDSLECGSLYKRLAVALSLLVWKLGFGLKVQQAIRSHDSGFETQGPRFDMRDARRAPYKPRTVDLA